MSRPDSRPIEAQGDVPKDVLYDAKRATFRSLDGRRKGQTFDGLWFPRAGEFPRFQVVNEADDEASLIRAYDRDNATDPAEAETIHDAPDVVNGEDIMNERVGPKDHDPVNHPRHYTSHPSGIECITITRHMGFNLGNALKYIWRADLKNGVEDLEKAAWYIADEIAKRKS